MQEVLGSNPSRGTKKNVKILVINFIITIFVISFKITIIMKDVNKKIETFKIKLLHSNSLEKIIYSEAIILLENDVNPDKVQNWINNVLNNFSNKPRALSEKEKKQIADKLANKEAKKKEGELLFKSLNDKMSDLLNKYDVLIIGFFDWKEMSNSECDFFEKLVKDKGYYFNDNGDGAIELFITKKQISKEFLKEFNKIECELNNFTKGSILDKYKTYDLSEFRNRVLELPSLSLFVK